MSKVTLGKVHLCVNLHPTFFIYRIYLIEPSSVYRREGYECTISCLEEMHVLCVSQF